MSFAFADSPQGGGEAGTPDASGGRAFLLHTAKRNWFSGKLVSLATRWDELNTHVQASGQLLLPL
jgi:hypothetical protein